MSSIPLFPAVVFRYARGVFEANPHPKRNAKRRQAPGLIRSTVVLPILVKGELMFNVARDCGTD